MVSAPYFSSMEAMSFSFTSGSMRERTVTSSALSSTMADLIAEATMSCEMRESVFVTLAKIHAERLEAIW